MSTGGQCVHNCVTSTAAFIANAASVLNIGQVPKNSTIPRPEMQAEISASVRHASAGIRMPQNDIAAATKPISDRTQNVLATMVAVRGGSEGSSQLRAGRHPRRRGRAAGKPARRARRRDRARAAAALRR
jgi:hypothetical protein